MKSIQFDSRDMLVGRTQVNAISGAGSGDGTIDSGTPAPAVSTKADCKLSELSYNSVRSAYWMTIGFSILFFGVGAVQQYIAVWFQERGAPHVGKITLVVVYLFYFLGSFQAHRVLSLLGGRLCMMVTALTYGLLIVSIWSGLEWLSYITAAISGLTASLLWTGQNIVLNQISDAKLRSKAIAQFWTRYPLGTGLGTLTLGLLIGQFSFSGPVLSFALIATASCYFFWRMPLESLPAKSAAGSKTPSFHRITVGCALTVFFVRFVYGLVISQVPLDLSTTIGSGYVGLITSPFFILPIIVSKPVTLVASKWGIFASAYTGFIVSGLGIACMLMPLSGLTVVGGVGLVALASAIINPVSNLLPKWITDSASIDLSRIAGTFSLAGSSGILAGLLSMTIMTRANAYMSASALLMVSAISLWLASRVSISKDSQTAMN